MNHAVRTEINAKHAVSDGIGEITAAGNLKDPDKIAASIAERTAKAVADLAERKAAGLAAAEEGWRKTAIDASKGQIFSIAWAFGDDPIDCRISGRIDHEADLLRQFFAAIDPTYVIDASDLLVEDAQEVLDTLRSRYRVIGSTADMTAMLSPPRVVAHYADFDIRFIWQRAVVLGVRVPTWWPINVPTWQSDRVFCTMAAWAGRPPGRIGLDRLCKALGLPGKSNFDGSQVWDAVREGRIAEVIEYNCADVHRLRACFRRLNFLPPAAEVAA